MVNSYHDPTQVSDYPEVFAKAAELGKKVILVERAVMIAEFSGYPQVCEKIIELGNLTTNDPQLDYRMFEADVTEEGLQFLAPFVERFNIQNKVGTLLSPYGRPLLFKVLLNLPEWDEKKELFQEVIAWGTEEMIDTMMAHVGI